MHYVYDYRKFTNRKLVHALAVIKKIKIKRKHVACDR